MALFLSVTLMWLPGALQPLQPEGGFSPGPLTGVGPALRLASLRSALAGKQRGENVQRQLVFAQKAQMSFLTFIRQQETVISHLLF